MRVSAIAAATVATALSIALSARAQPTPPPPPPAPPKPIVQQLPKGQSPLVNLTEVARFGTTAGFIDDVVATDDTNARLVYVVADAAAKAELHIVTLATSAEQVIDIAPITLHPASVALVGKDRAFVVGQLEDGSQMAALVDLSEKKAGTAIWKLPAATHITLLGPATAPRVIVHRAVPGPKEKTGGTRHEIDVVSLTNGKRVQAGRGLELDDGGANHALEWRLNSWSDGYTRAYGIKSGTYDAKNDRRTPDVEATYDLVSGKIIATDKIGDLFEQRRRYQALNEAVDKVDFVRFAWDNSGIQVWKASKGRNVELDQALGQYDPKSLQGLVAADGSAWILLKVDPVNADAVARKKADLEFLDLFHVDAGATKAQRKARIFAPGTRYRMGLVGDKIWLLERNTGFERGGKALTIYSVTP